MTSRMVRLAIFVALFVLGFAAVALAQSISWVSVSPTGSGGEAPVAVSDDGRYVAFRAADDAALVPGDTNDDWDVFVRDMQTGAVERVSVSSTGAQVIGDSGGTTVDISNDGRYVLFDSLASGLVAGDTNNSADLFIRDRQTDSTTRIVRDDGEQGEGASSDGSLSGDGRYVSFIATGFNVPSYGVAGTARGVFVADRTSGDVERLRLSTAFSAVTSISDDGRYVAFITREFDSNDDILLVDRNTDTNTTEVVANPRIGGAASTHRTSSMSLSGNGRFVVFVNEASNLVAGDTEDTDDIFVFNANTGILERMIPSAGISVRNDSRPDLSDDGRYLSYTFDPDSGNTRVAVRDRNAGTDTVISVFDDGTLPNPNSRESAISGSGRYVAFQSNAAFDSGDSGGSTDVYIVDREGTPGGGACSHDFSDVDGSNIFEDDICWLADQGITRGCNPPSNTEFCPKDPVTRGQMAAFLVRAFGYTDNGGGNLFTDDNGTTFEGDIDRLGTAGVTRGCNPPSNTQFCPDDTVTRGQMAAFLVRAFSYTDNGGGNLFTDDNGNTFEADIDRLGTAGVTRGCNPPSNTEFCPNDNVTREQMAAFLRRAFEG